MVSPIAVQRRREEEGRREEGGALDVACSIHLHKHKQQSSSENTNRDKLRGCLVTAGFLVSWPGLQGYLL